MNGDEALAVADLHREGIPQGFLSRLGRRFRAEMYRGVAAAPHSGVWVAVTDDGDVVGFISGTANIGRCYRAALLSRGLFMAFYALPSLVSPGNWVKIFETLAYPRKEEADAAPPGNAETAGVNAELLSIVVAARGRGTGAAGRLVAELEDELRQSGHQGPYRVVTMAADPRSNAFYRKVGFTHVREFRHHGIAMNLYHKTLDQ